MQQRTLIRARGLSAFRQAVVDLAVDGSPRDIRRRVVVVPTRASAELLRQTIEASASGAGPRAIVLPDFVTRYEWINRLHEAVPGAGPLLTRVEREVLMERAAAASAQRRWIVRAPFQLRSGLVSAMLDFYDELRRRQRTVRRFAGALFDQLRVERGTDRGSESLIEQTAFLGLTFLAYQRLVRAAHSLDEHLLRDRLLAEALPMPFDHVVVAVADHPTDPRGLWPADFDLVGRLSGLGRVDVVMTEETHDAGFRERLELELPGIVERTAVAAPESPILITPLDADDDTRVFVSRDREEELRDVVRVIWSRAGRTERRLQESVGVVFHRPLPYLYLAQQVLTDARVPYQAFDALPLGAEPYAALLDLVLTAASAGATSDAYFALLRSALLAFDVDGATVALEDVTTLEEVLTERRVAGDASTYPDEMRDFFGTRASHRRLDAARAHRAAAAAAAARAALEGFHAGTAASGQVATLATFLRAHERMPALDAPEVDRHRRARAAVLGVLDGLADAYRRHADHVRPHDVLIAMIRLHVEAQTFTPRRGDAGVHLVDAVAARFARFDHVHLVGSVEADWPDRPRRSLFYTSGLLKALGWPQEPDHARAERAAFRDLLGLATLTTRLHAFQLDADQIATVTPLADLARGLPSRPADPLPGLLVFSDEILTRASFSPEAVPAHVAAWWALRDRRPPMTTPAYRGYVGPQPPEAYRVSKVDHYATCPFKYFSESVLRLPEERDEVAGLSPLERGTLLHELFEHFYKEWAVAGHGAITAATLPEAHTRFAALTHAALARLPEPDRALEEARLLGSMVGRGVAERVFELEVDAGDDIARRLLETELNGEFSFPVQHGLAHTRIRVRGKADRIDVLHDGSLKVVDYKSGAMPDLDVSMQVAVYAHCASQHLSSLDGQPHPIESAMYLAFGDDRRLEGRLSKKSEPAEMAVLARASVFAAAVTRIESGEFPPQPHQPQICGWCRYAGVCRKEYQQEEGDAAEPV